MLFGERLLGTSNLGLRLFCGPGTQRDRIGLLDDRLLVGLVDGASIGHRLIARVGAYKGFVGQCRRSDGVRYRPRIDLQCEFWFCMRVLVGVWPMMSSTSVLEARPHEGRQSTPSAGMVSRQLTMAVLPWPGRWFR